MEKPVYVSYVLSGSVFSSFGILYSGENNRKSCIGTDSCGECLSIEVYFGRTVTAGYDPDGRCCPVAADHGRTECFKNFN